MSRVEELLALVAKGGPHISSVGELISLLESDLAASRAEAERLRAGLGEAREVIRAAFGEYACMIKAKLTEAEIVEFERNFAVPARRALG